MTKITPWRTLLATLLLLGSWGCGDDDSGTDDAGVDAADASEDTAVDSSVDADAGTDGSADAGTDSSPSDTGTGDVADAADAMDAGDPADIFDGLDPVVVASLSGDGEALAAARPWCVSGDGRYVFFDTVGALSALDDNDAQDVYVFDRLSESVTLLSRTTSGGAAGGLAPECTPDGRLVFFQSASADVLAAGEDTNGVGDSLVLDRDADGDGEFDEFEEAGGVAYSRLSLSTEGAEGNAGSSNALPSSNGRFAAFLSTATNLVPGVPAAPAVFRAYLRDRDVDADGVFDEPGEVRTILLARLTDGEPTSTRNALAIGSTVVSDDGRYVGFAAEDGIVEGDTNGLRDLFVYDRDTDADGVLDEEGFTARIRISVASDGSQMTGEGGDVTQFTMSRDGRFFFFGSSATGLDPSDSGDVQDLFIHDRDTDEDGVFDEPGAIETRILVRGPEGELLDGFASDPVVSDDLRFVAFESAATNFEEEDNGAIDVFVIDRDPTGSGTLDTDSVVVQVSVSPEGAALSEFSANPLISANGVVVAFQTADAAFSASTEASQVVWALNPAR